MHKFFNKNRILSLFILVFCVFLLVGCGESQSEKLWNNYVDAVNNQNLEEVAKTFYVDAINGVEQPNYTKFLQDNSNYFADLSSLKTISYEEDVNCDFSRGEVIQTYYGAKVKVLVNNATEREVYIYSYSDTMGTFFCSEFNFDSESTGNNPSANWTDKVYYTNEDYKYKVDKDNKGIYVEKVSNSKDVVIPSTVDGAPVESIGEYAFYKYNKVLCFTIPSSKMKTVEIPEGIKTINKYAFYQCKKLEEVTIPESVSMIDAMAFASCTGMEKLEIQARTQLTNNAEVESTYKEGGFKIIGAHNLQTGEILDLAIDDSLRGVKWSLSQTGVLSLSGNRVIALAPGDVEITATDIKDPTVTATVKISVTKTPASLTIADDAFNRCNDLKEIYLHAYNPNSIEIVNGSNFTFNSECKIYVPKGSLDMYKSHILWSPYADNIYEVKDTEEALLLPKAQEVFNGEVGTNATLNGIYAYKNPTNIDNILYAFNYTEAGVEKNLIIDAYVGSFLKDTATAKVLKVEDYSEIELLNILSLGANAFGDIIPEKEFESEKYAQKVKDYQQAIYNYIAPIILADSEKLEAELNQGVTDPAKQVDLETYMNFENTKIVFEDMIVEAGSAESTVCYATFDVNLTDPNNRVKVIYNDSLVIIKDIANNSYQFFNDTNLEGSKEVLYQAIVQLLLTSNKIA